MLKKILLPLLLLATIQPMLSMEIDYEPLFLACEKGNLDLVKNIIKNTPNININQQDSEGRTPLLCAAYKGQWNIIHYLLINKADKTIRDNYGQSLFSKMVYECFNTRHKFYKSLKFYTFDEITLECTTMPLPQHPLDYQQIKSLPPHTLDVLAGIKNINSEGTDVFGNTALYEACLYRQIPTTIELLKRGACLEQKNKWNNSPYNTLRRHEKKSPFVIREALNNGCAPVLLSAGLSHDTNNSLTQDLLPEIIGLIKPLYINAIKEDFLSTPEARIWKPVCIDACKLADIDETDENCCLTHIMTLPQRKKTEINLLLLKEGQ